MLKREGHSRLCEPHVVSTMACDACCTEPSAVERARPGRGCLIDTSSGAVHAYVMVVVPPFPGPPNLQLVATAGYVQRLAHTLTAHGLSFRRAPPFFVCTGLYSMRTKAPPCRLTQLHARLASSIATEARPTEGSSGSGLRARAHSAKVGGRELHGGVSAVDWHEGTGHEVVATDREHRLRHLLGLAHARHRLRGIE